jgi:hypothetical protein
MEIFIKGNVPSSKNSKQITAQGLLINSKTVRKYDKEFGSQWNDERLKRKFKEAIENKVKPLRIGFYFHRSTRRKFDYVNVAQYPLDMMVKNGWIEDDDATNVIPYFLGYEVTKNSGVTIVVGEE